MLEWTDAVKQIDESRGSPSIRSRFWWYSFPRRPVAVVGFSGAGKTELWRQLTLGHAKDEASETFDSGYYFRNAKRGALNLTTIPGPDSRDCSIVKDQLFADSGTSINGVIFVACYGHNYIWPGKSEAVASSIRPVSRRELIKRNSGEELALFKETCELIAKKRSIADPAKSAKWLLVLCNKADLYWDKIDTANDYYGFNADSDFGNLARDLVANRAGPGFRYHVLPTAIRMRDYKFDSTQGSLEFRSRLSQPQCDASLNLVVEALEELSGRQQH